MTLQFVKTSKKRLLVILDQDTDIGINRSRQGVFRSGQSLRISTFNLACAKVNLVCIYGVKAASPSYILWGKLAHRSKFSKFFEWPKT